LGQPRKPRVLWAKHRSLIDTTSGAAVEVREMLRQLAARGLEISILGATVFDSETVARILSAAMRKASQQQVDQLELVDGPLVHRLIVTANWSYDEMTSLGACRT
jgi:hypothetical protein